MANNQTLVLTAQELLIELYNRADPTNQMVKPHCADFVRYGFFESDCHSCVNPVAHACAHVPLHMFFSSWVFVFTLRSRIAVVHAWCAPLMRRH